MNLVFRKPYIYATVSVFLLYMLLTIFLSGFYSTIPLIMAYAGAVNWIKLGLSLFLSFVIGSLVAINAVSVYIKYRERKKCAEAGAVATIGTMGGLVVGVCPLCITGIVPIVLGTLGVSFSFASLPFQGIEIQLMVVIMLLTSFWMLHRK